MNRAGEGKHTEVTLEGRVKREGSGRVSGGLQTL